MKQVRVRKGIAHLNIAGQDLLVADTEARRYCPFVWEIGSGAARFWDLIEKGNDTNEILRICSLENRDTIRDEAGKLIVFMVKCKKYGYLIEEGT